MQQLRFEEKWDKTLSDQDRQEIIKVFNSSKDSLDQKITFTPLWQAINHNNDLLVSVIVHNPTRERLTFQNKTVYFIANKDILANYTFNIPALKVEPFTSMPWTFIYPKTSLNQEITNNKGYLMMK